MCFNHSVATRSIVSPSTMELRAMLKAPSRVPYGLHGHWLSEEELRAMAERAEAE